MARRLGKHSHSKLPKNYDTATAVTFSTTYLNKIALEKLCSYYGITIDNFISTALFHEVVERCETAGTTYDTFMKHIRS